MKLYIDSTNNLRTLLRLGEKEFTRKFSSPRDQDTFAFIMEILKREGVNLKDLTEIEVNPGPGSFTGSRLGVTIGNALAFSLGLTVNGCPPPIKPVYPSEVTWKSQSSAESKG